MAMEIIGLPVMEKGKTGSNASMDKGQMDGDFFNILAALMNPARIPCAAPPETVLQDTEAVLSPIPPAKEQSQALEMAIPQVGREAPQMTAGDKLTPETPVAEEKSVISQLLTVTPQQQDQMKHMIESKQEAQLPPQDSMEQIIQVLKEAVPAPASLHHDPTQELKENRIKSLKSVHAEQIQTKAGAAPGSAPGAAAVAEEEGLTLVNPGLQAENPKVKHEDKKDVKTALTTGDVAEKTEKPEKVKIPLSHPNPEKRDHESLELNAPPLHGLARGHGNEDSIKAPSESGIRLPAEKLAVELPGIIDTKLMSGVQGNNRTLVIHLEPKELGKLMVKLSDQDGVVTVRIVTDNPETKTIVQNSLPDLRLSFTENGIKYGRLEVELDGQSLQQHQHPQQNQQNQQQHQHHNHQQTNWSMGAASGSPKHWLENYTYSGIEASPIMDRNHMNQGQVDYTV